MISIGSLVIYGANGICTITDKRQEKLYGKINEYYILNPVNNAGAVIYVPANNESLVSKMKKLLTEEEITHLLSNIANEDTEWIEDNKIRTDTFNEILNKGDRCELLKLIKCIFLKKKELEKENKKLRITDENTLKLAEKTINEEFSLVLGISTDMIPDFIEKNLP